MSIKQTWTSSVQSTCDWKFIRKPCLIYKMPKQDIFAFRSSGSMFFCTCAVIIGRIPVREIIVTEIEDGIKGSSLMNEHEIIRKAVSNATMEVNKIAKDLAGAIVELEDGRIFLAECECCGLKEECTEEYISQIRNSFSGKWVCGLCSEAVEEQLNRKPVDIEEAMNTHRNFVQEFNDTTRYNPKLSLTWEMRNIARRSCANRRKNKLA